MDSHFSDLIISLFSLHRTYLPCGCQLIWKMYMHYPNTDVSIDRCETPLEGSNHVQNASQLTPRFMQQCLVPKLIFHQIFKLLKNRNPDRW